ncbi:MAG: hypothetical protein OXG64_00565 [Chloroflexi bacterium]|nr:hypothetical protein [Chloroflexota bacterium]
MPRLRLRRALGIAGLLLALAFPPALADWPSTCVALNDQSEAALGRHANVGIYQRVYGEQAETYCRIDHQHDVRAAFGWAFPETTSPQPTPQPVPERAPRIDPALALAWTMLSETSTGRSLLGLPAASTVTVELGSIRPGAHAQYDGLAHVVTVSHTLRYERPAALAALLAHELWHAVSPYPYPRNAATCLFDELLAAFAAVGVWDTLRDGFTHSSLEQELEALRAAVAHDMATTGARFDEAYLTIDYWPQTHDRLFFLHGYLEVCAA